MGLVLDCGVPSARLFSSPDAEETSGDSALRTCKDGLPRNRVPGHSRQRRESDVYKVVMFCERGVVGVCWHMERNTEEADDQGDSRYTDHEAAHRDELQPEDRAMANPMQGVADPTSPAGRHSITQHACATLAR